MSSPNIVGTTTIYARTTGLSVPTTLTQIISNPALSGKVLKINTLMVANIDGATAYGITAEVFKNALNGYKIASGIIVPATSSIVLITKDSGIYLEENDSIRLSTTAAAKLDAICSYEEISST